MKILAALAVALLLAACASQNYADMPIAMQSVGASGTIAIAVHDTRPYIANKNKEESFVGLQRSGYGIPYDLKTPNGTPLAIEMRDSIAKALKARGASPVPVTVAVSDSSAAARAKLQQSKARRSVLVTLREWKTDTLMRTDFHYDTSLAVFDEGGRELASSSAKGVDGLGMSAAGGPEITQASAKKIEALFSDPKVAAALR
jgi:cobalamin biosynthesis Mg chelatase CobN